MVLLDLESQEFYQREKKYDITIADNFHHNQDDENFMNFVSDNNIKLFKADFTEMSSFDLLDKQYDDFYMLASMIGVNNTLLKILMK